MILDCNKKQSDRRHITRKISDEIIYWCQLLLLPVYLLSHLCPRNKSLWVFGSTFGHRFADNPKYLYLYAAKHATGSRIRAVWISRSREIIRFLNEAGHEAYYLYSLSGVWHSLRAGVYIYDNYSKDICYTLSGGAVKINLWHGLPLKKIQKDNIYDRVRNPVKLSEKLHALPRRISDEKPGDYVLSASEFFRPIFSSAFRTDNVLVAAYPRTDSLNSDTKAYLLTLKESSVIDKLKKANTGSIVLYMPTFRESEKRFFEVVDMHKFSEFLKEEDIALCIKLHHKSKLRTEFEKLDKEHIIVADPDADPYPLFDLADIMITDYSSIYFDFLLTDKPMVFFPYDYEEYLSGSRELYFDYEEFTPGIKVRSMEELMAALTGPDEYKLARRLLREKLFGGNEKQFGSESLLNMIMDMVQ